MNILLIGYGKMGRTLAELAPSHGLTVAGIADPTHGQPLASFDLRGFDVAIEFTRPEAAFDNVAHCLRGGLPVVSGSTGWLDRFAEAEVLTADTQGALFYASNYSVGVNLFFHFSEYVAHRMAAWPAYVPRLTEIHHVHKLDHPSGTALTTAQAVLRQSPALTGWQEVAPGEAALPTQLGIEGHREGEVVGTHILTYRSAVDELELKHAAYSRHGFADGALRAARWLVGRQGVFGMKEMLGL